MDSFLEQLLTYISRLASETTTQYLKNSDQEKVDLCNDIINLKDCCVELTVQLGFRMRDEENSCENVRQTYAPILKEAGDKYQVFCTTARQESAANIALCAQVDQRHQYVYDQIKLNHESAAILQVLYDLEDENDEIKLKRKKAAEAEMAAKREKKKNTKKTSMENQGGPCKVQEMVRKLENQMKVGSGSGSSSSTLTDEDKQSFELRFLKGSIVDIVLSKNEVKKQQALRDLAAVFGFTDEEKEKVGLKKPEPIEVDSD